MLRNTVHKGYNNTPRGFTLIELLVVIAIIALLAAILFPVFARARENARKSSCSNNLKQLAVGVAQYTQDFDEAFPWAWNPVNGSNVNWWQIVYPYVKNTQVFSCPSDSSRIAGGNGFSGQPAPNGYVDGRFHISYGVNYPIFANGGAGTGTAFNLSDMPKPSQTVLMCDTGVTSQPTEPYIINPPVIGSKGSAWLLCDPTCTNSGTFPNPKPCNAGAAANPGASTDSNWSAANPRHLDSVNVTFADGHVKSMPARKFYYQDSNYLNPRIGGP
jgi:prepilin-type N-terminal cleavage/methylation domain-containing protein/prepilin-type processing-associated H-X9-DG protein